MEQSISMLTWSGVEPMCRWATELSREVPRAVLYDMAHPTQGDNHLVPLYLVGRVESGKRLQQLDQLVGIYPARP